MSNLCETLIKQAITADCENPIVRGLERTIHGHDCLSDNRHI